MKSHYLFIVLAVTLVVACILPYAILASTYTNTITGVVISSPVATPEAGSYSSAQTIALTDPGSSSIHYTTDGSSVTCSSGSLYTETIAVSTATTITAIACYGNNYTSSTVSFSYNIGAGGGSSGISQKTNNTPTKTTDHIVGDINQDDTVNEYDFALMMFHWNKTSKNAADLNSDGIVDESDLSLLIANWSS